MFNLGMSEIILILVVALVFLGPRKLPELASGIGKMIREVRKATADIKQEIELDDTIRKPLEELREATMLPPEELKRRDMERQLREQYEREERERQEAEERETAERAEREARELAEQAEKAQAPATPPPVVGSDKTIAMPSPFTSVSPTDTIAAPPPGAPAVVLPPQTVPARRPTNPGVGPQPAGASPAAGPATAGSPAAGPPAGAPKPGMAPPPPPPLPPAFAAGKLPPPAPGRSPLPPPPPVKKV